MDALLFVIPALACAACMVGMALMMGKGASGVFRRRKRETGGR